MHKTMFFTLLKVVKMSNVTKILSHRSEGSVGWLAVFE